MARQSMRVSNPALYFTLHVDPDSPFLKVDPERTVEENIHTMLVGMADWGEKSVQAQWTDSSRGRGGVQGRVAGIETGHAWRFHAVVTPGFTYPWRNKGARGFSGRSDAEYRGGHSRVRMRAFKNTRYRIASATKKFSFDLNGGVWS